MSEQSSKQIAVKVDNLTKTFRIPTESSSGIKQKLINRMKGKKGYREFTPLKDISIEIEKGDFFGIVGRNGSGKSTLLKSIANIYTPTRGSVHVDGTLVPFIELGVGFNPELTGRENVFLNGALLGFSRSEMEAMYDEIVEFAEISDFMDEKLKNYSSGMQVRLAFSIAIRADADILLLDEVLAVGDEAFQRKCFNYFAQLKKEKKTVILVTHSMESVQQFCTKAIMIEKGEVIAAGNPAVVAQKYRELFMDKGLIGKKINNATIANENFAIDADYRNNGSHLSFDVSIMPKISIDDPVIAFTISNARGEIVYRWVSDEKITESIKLVKDVKSGFKLKIQNIFPNDLFNVNIALKKRDRTLNYAAFREIISFEVVNSGQHVGDVHWKPEETYEQK